MANSEKTSEAGDIISRLDALKNTKANEHADLIEDAIVEIEMLRDSEMRGFGRIYAIREALGVGGMKADLSDLGGECKRALASALEQGRRESAAMDPGQTVEAVLLTFERCASTMVSDGYATGYREAIEHVLRAIDRRAQAPAMEPSEEAREKAKAVLFEKGIVDTFPMTIELTPERIEELRKLAEAATPGLWISTKKREIGVLSTADDQSFGMVIAHADADSVEDATFIAAAREAVPALITEIETLRAAVEALTVERDEAQANFTTLQKAVVGETGRSAIEVVAMLSTDRDEAIERAEAAEQRAKECSAALAVGRRDALDLVAENQEIIKQRYAAIARVAVLEKTLEPIVTEFSCTIEQYYKLGPDFTHKDGTEVFAVQSILDREPLIEAARAALSGKE